jgi:hypothetical protein
MADCSVLVVTRNNSSLDCYCCCCFASGCDDAAGRCCDGRSVGDGDRGGT